MILTVGNTKGGVGKTTFAVNLAIALSKQGDDVLLIDGDTQSTAMSFTQIRAVAFGTPEKPGNPGYTAVSLIGAAIRTQVQQFKAKYDHIVIDVGGTDNGSLRAALTVSDLVIVPVVPSSFDVWAVDQMEKLVAEARVINDRLRAITFLNAADPSPNGKTPAKDNEAAAAELRGLADIEYLDFPVIRRKAFRNAAASGMSILDSDDPKAIEEFTLLMGELGVYTKAISEKAYGNR